MSNRSLPPKYRLKHYAAENFCEPKLATLLGAAASLSALLRSQRVAVAAYHVEFLSGADATELGALGDLCARALPAERLPKRAPATALELLNRLLALSTQTEAVANAALTLERDGLWVGGEFS